jgi:SAM-dependent methyltransferase
VTSIVDRPARSPEALVERLFNASIQTMDLFGVYIGQRLGYYESLAAREPANSVEFAAQTGTDERYAREWLEQQAVSGILDVDDPGAAPTARRYSLPAEHVTPLTDALDLNFIAPLARAVVAASARLPDVVEAFRTGGGVSYEAYGADGREAQAAFNRPFLLGPFVPEYLARIPGLEARLRTAGARVAEIGCGGGWGVIALAGAYPAAEVHGYDLDGPSIDLARRNAAEAGLGKPRVSFECRDAGDPALAGRYDLVFAFECIHDMANPVEALASMRRLAAPGATILVVDERVADEFTVPGDEVERMMYGWSLAWCLPTGRETSPSAATGTVMRAATLEGYARQAGFAAVEVLPLEHDLFRFYQLVP